MPSSWLEGVTGLAGWWLRRCSHVGPSVTSAFGRWAGACRRSLSAADRRGQLGARGRRTLSPPLPLRCRYRRTWSAGWTHSSTRSASDPPSEQRRGPQPPRSHARHIERSHGSFAPSRKVATEAQLSTRRPKVHSVRSVCPEASPNGSRPRQSETVRDSPSDLQDATDPPQHPGGLSIRRVGAPGGGHPARPKDPGALVTPAPFSG